MDFFGHHIDQMTPVLGPVIILAGFGQYFFYKHIVSYSERTIEELDDKSLLGFEGTKRTPMGGKITMTLGLVIFLGMFMLDFFWGMKTEDLKFSEQVHKRMQESYQKRIQEKN